MSGNETVYHVVGISRGVSKKSGKPYTILHVNSRFDDYMTEHGSEGLKAENVYISASLNITIDSFVTLIYGRGFGNQAIVVGVMEADSSNF